MAGVMPGAKIAQTATSGKFGILHWRLGRGSATGHASHGLREIGTDRHGSGTGTRSPAALTTHGLRQIGTANSANCNFFLG